MAQKTLNVASITIDSSFITYNSLLIAKAESEAPTDKMAVLEIKEEPGRASIIDCAFFDGSSAGTLDAYRLEVRVVDSGWRVRMGRAGRSRAAPTADQHHCRCERSCLYLEYSTYRQYFLSIELPLHLCGR